MENQGCISRQQQAGKRSHSFFILQQTGMGGNAQISSLMDAVKRQRDFSGWRSFIFFGRVGTGAESHGDLMAEAPSRGLAIGLTGAACLYFPI